jgi:2-polyprenyl-3-methyl-5-hydroxy-6-metoxy-1,4-benzoquinol methylase
MTSDPGAPLAPFISQLEQGIQTAKWKRLLLSKYRGQDTDLQRVAIRLITLRGENALSFVYSYTTRDITKNFAPAQGLAEIETLLSSDFKSAHYATDGEETQLMVSKKGKISVSSHKLKQASNKPVSDTAHNREKRRFVDIQRPFLQALGVTDAQHTLIPAMSRKWKQINKFIEVFSQALEQASINQEQAVQVVDFGSGKGYLTFAIHDYLTHTLHNQATVTGVELRAELAELCNQAALNLHHQGLEFVCGDVKTHAPKHTDVMIALHACDVATDYAIHYGIRAGAAIIMCSPCCHKQIRPQMQSPTLLKPMLQYGVHLGQQAEMVTDSMRALLLEAHGYSTKVFEFISLEHTNKNKMILAVKKSSPVEESAVLKQIAAIKEFYGIKEHCLESLLQESAQT